MRLVNFYPGYTCILVPPKDGEIIQKFIIIYYICMYDYYSRKISFQLTPDK